MGGVLGGGVVQTDFVLPLSSKTPTLERVLEQEIGMSSHAPVIPRFAGVAYTWYLVPAHVL